jgi:hypothetical protein
MRLLLLLLLLLLCVRARVLCLCGAACSIAVRTIVFGDGHAPPDAKRLEQKFSAGDTGLAMKKRLFDLFDVNYENLLLKHGDNELIGATIGARVPYCAVFLSFFLLLLSSSSSLSLLTHTASRTWAYGSTTHIDPLSICDAPSLRGQSSFAVHVEVSVCGFFFFFFGFCMHSALSETKPQVPADVWNAAAATHSDVFDAKTTTTTTGNSTD